MNGSICNFWVSLFEPLSLFSLNCEGKKRAHSQQNSDSHGVCPSIFTFSSELTLLLKSGYASRALGCWPWSVESRERWEEGWVDKSSCPGESVSRHTLSDLTG